MLRGLLFSVWWEERKTDASNILTNKQTNKQCVFCIRIKCPAEHNMSHSLCIARCTCWHLYLRQLGSSSAQSGRGLPKQLPAARMGSENWLCRRSCAASLKIHHNPGGSRHLSLNTHVSCKKPPPVSGPCNSSSFTRIFPAPTRAEGSADVLLVRLEKPALPLQM